MTLAITIPDAWRRDLVPLIAGGVVLVILLVWIGLDGAYNATVWYPSALGLMSVWVLVLSWQRRVLPQPRVARVALLAFVALVAFNYVSIAWAGSRGSALDSSNQLALYLLGGWIFALLPWTPRRLALLAGLWSLGVCVFCTVALARAASAPTLTSFFIDGRFATPMQYSNATAALGAMGMWPALILSSRRELRVWLRAGCLALATFLAVFAVLPQSRAALLGMVLTAPLSLVVMSDRLRLLSRLLVVGGAVALCLPRIIDVNDAVSAGARVTPVLRHAALLMALCAAGALLIGVCLGLLENRLAPAERPRAVPDSSIGTRGARDGSRRTVLTAAAVGVAVVIVAAAVIVARPHIVHLVHQTVQKGNTDAGIGSNRFLSTSPEERFDYDRVALHLFSGAPAAGIGSGNFGRRYDALRKFTKHSQYTHNLPLRVLSETGVIGVILFLILVGALVVGMIRVARRRSDLGRACVGFAFTVSGYFLVHSCLDWMDAFPALAIPALGLPLATLTFDGPRRSQDDVPGSQRAARRSASLGARRLGVGVLGAGALVVLVALAASYLSLVSINRAFAVSASDPQQAYHDLDVARRLDPLSVNPLTSEGTIALYAGDTSRSARAFGQSVNKEDNWYPRLELALIDAHRGRFEAARRQLNAAAALDANDPLITDARMMIDRHRRIDPIAFNDQLKQEGNSSASVQQTIK